MKLEQLISALTSQYDNARNDIITNKVQEVSVTSPYYIEDENAELSVKMSYIKPAPFDTPEGAVFCGRTGPCWQAVVSVSPANDKVKAVMRKFFAEKKHPPCMGAPSTRIFNDIKINEEQINLPGM